jgi:hypothetical protein
VTILAVSLLVSILALSLLIGWLIVQLRLASKQALDMAKDAMALMKAASVEEHTRAQIMKERDAMYRKQLEDALATEQEKKSKPAPKEEIVEIIDDVGHARQVDFSRLEAIGPDDILDLMK